MGVSESEFNMWRAVFAVVHADSTITNAEIRFMAEALERPGLSPAQKHVLEEDIRTPKDCVEMFRSIDEPEHRAEFFRLARKFVWADGDYAAAEQAMMQKLFGEQARTVDFERLIGRTGLELEDFDER